MNKESFELKELQKVFTSDDGNINFIEWIYYRLKDVHNEDKRIDYMRKLKEISDWVEKKII
jgi:hypothetical protein